jgi:Pentapeptide repeats (8 copies)
VGALLTFWLNSQVYRLTEQGHITERYTKAIEQLGSDKLDIRLGGIYALERIAVDSGRDHPTVVEVLSAFVREHSHPTHTTAPDRTIAVVRAALRRRWSKPTEASQPSPSRQPKPPADVGTAVTVLGRLPQRPGVARGDLSDALLAGAQLAGVNLAGAQLAGADLAGAWLAGADLAGANLHGADLAGAWLGVRSGGTGRSGLEQLIPTNLSGANLAWANLAGAQLNQAYLIDADLFNAALSGAWLQETKLNDARLRQANLAGAVLPGADLSDALLQRVDLSGALLQRAKLSGARLHGVDLRQARELAQPQLDVAQGDALTQLPAGLLKFSEVWWPARPR